MTVGELRKALEGVPDEVEVKIKDQEIGDLDPCGEAKLVQTYKKKDLNGNWFHTEVVETWDKGVEPYGQAFLID